MNLPFGCQAPFKIKLIFNIPKFEGKINVGTIDNRLSKLETHFPVNHFSDI